MSKHHFSTGLTETSSRKVFHDGCAKRDIFSQQILNKGDVVSFHPTTESNLRTALGVEICKLCIIARIYKPFSDLCREMGICLQI